MAEGAGPPALSKKTRLASTLAWTGNPSSLSERAHVGATPLPTVMYTFSVSSNWRTGAGCFRWRPDLQTLAKWCNFWQMLHFFPKAGHALGRWKYLQLPHGFPCSFQRPQRWNIIGFQIQPQHKSFTHCSTSGRRSTPWVFTCHSRYTRSRYPCRVPRGPRMACNKNHRAIWATGSGALVPVGTECNWCFHFASRYSPAFRWTAGKNTSRRWSPS